jgi:hypothetical protein
MKSSWTLGLSEQQVQEVRKEYASSPVLRERLAILLRNKLDVSETNAQAKVNYEKPSWAYHQADANGYKRAINEIISLIITKSVD